MSSTSRAGPWSGLGSRRQALERLAASATHPLDLLVVGGGVTGAGIALDAAARGLSVGLIERNDFASGASSKSSKLIHGGLRYLQGRHFGLVREGATERDLLRKLAPHLVEPLGFVLPVTGRAMRAKFGAGLWAYDALASFRARRVHKYLGPAETAAALPALPPNRVSGGFLYYDCKTDDVRLVMEVLLAASRRGAVVANYAAAVDISGAAAGCRATVRDETSGTEFEVGAKRVLVAAGVWADRVERLAAPAAPDRLRPSKGVHLLFSRRDLPVGETAALIPDAEGRRMLFVIPWLSSVLVGTTDTEFSGDLDRPRVGDADRAYCLDALNSMFGLDLGPADIVGAYAGLRPLIAGKAGDTADLSRRHRVYELGPGVVGITGGKLTTWRRMAADAVDRVAGDLGCAARSTTRSIRLGSVDPGALRPAVARRAGALGVSKGAVDNLVRAYGDRALSVLDTAAEDLRAPLVDDHPWIAAEAAYCRRNEMVVHLSDFLARRTRLALTDRSAGCGSGSRAPMLVAAEMGWTKEELAAEVAAFRSEVASERGLPVAEAPSADEISTER